MIKKVLIVLGVVAIIPTLCLLVSLFVSAKYESTWQETINKEASINPEINLKLVPKLAEICQNQESHNQFENACSYVDEIQEFHYYSIYSLICSVGLVLFVVTIGLIGRINRLFLACTFRPSLYLILFVLCILLAGQGALATYGVYIFESTAIGRVHTFLIAGIALTAFYGVLRLLLSIFKIPIKASTHIFGIAIERKVYPKLYAYVEKIAKTLDAKPPTNIILGIEPSFFVTCANVIAINKEFKGETMYLSLPLLKFLKEDEVTAIIGHELGHFKGKDTLYSKKFYPIYRGTENAISALSRIRGANNEAPSFILLPAIMLLDLFYSTFSQTEHKFGQQREFEADWCGASMSSSQSFATGLIKASVIGQLWHSIQGEMVKALNEGKFISNISDFIAICLKEATLIQHIFDSINDYRFSHPTDTHPTIHERVEKLGLNLTETIANSQNISMDGKMVNELIENNVDLEEELSNLEHRKLLALGFATLPSGSQT